jgi:hypothetical protein
MFKSDAELWNMFEAIKMNTFKRETITIHLLDESNAMCGWDQASKLLGNEKGEQDDTIN